MNEGTLVSFTGITELSLLRLRKQQQSWQILFVIIFLTGSISGFNSFSCVSPGLARVQHVHVLFP